MRHMRLLSGCFTTRVFPLVRNSGFRRLSMTSKYLDMPPLGARRVKRAEATLLERRPADLVNLDSPALLEYALALSIILVAAQEGFRLAPEVLALAESVA